MFCFDRGRSYPEILESLLSRVSRGDLCARQRVLGRRLGNGQERAALGSAAPAAVHTALPHPGQSPGQAGRPLRARGMSPEPDSSLSRCGAPPVVVPARRSGLGVVLCLNVTRELS